MTSLLLVEDDPDVATVLRMFLRSLGFRVTLAATLDEARAALARDPPAVIITDDGLPDGAGSAWLGDVAAQRPDTPLVLLTAHATPLHPVPPKTLVRQKPWALDDAERTLRRLRDAVA